MLESKKMQHQSDSELINSFLKGNRQAFGELVARYQDYVYNLALRLVGNTADAEDLVQEIFIQVMRKVGGWRGEAKFGTWLYRVAANQCYDWLRKRHSEIVSFEDNDLSGGEDPVARVEQLDFKERVLRELVRLPLDFRLVVVLRDIQGLSYEEIAESLEISLGTVKSRLSRGRALLAAQLRPVWEQNELELHQKG